MESKLKESDWAKIRYEQLNLISEKRLVAIYHTSCINKKMAKAYDKKVRPRGILGRRYSVEKDLPLLDKDQSK
jgi:hypothetical protein